MNETLTRYRNKIAGRIYKHAFKPFFFRRDPEDVHDGMTRVGKMLGKHRVGRSVTRAFLGYQHPMLRQDILGVSFPNPVGLSAGFDKNVELVDIMPSVGFGFVEVGSITGYPCPGNAKPRLWRLPESKSLVVYYGLKNDGCEAIARRLQLRQPKHFGVASLFAIPVGMSIAMTNNSDNADLATAVKDYAKSFRTMEPYANYLTVNISCPNTCGGQPFTDPARLEALLSTIDTIPTSKPIFIKLSPDLSVDDVDALLAVAAAHRVHGIVCTNLTKRRDNPAILDDGVPDHGGLGGKVVQEQSDALLAHAYRTAGDRFVLIGVGGIFTAEDAYRKIRLGANLVQLITGMIFQGPQLISQINQGLVELLKRDGFASVSEAIGVDAR